MEKTLRTYQKRKKAYYDMLEKENKIINIFSNLRLLVAIIGIVAISFLSITKNYFHIYYLLPLFIAVFTFLVIKTNTLKLENKYTSAIYKTNEDSLDRIQGDWGKFKDKGLEFKDDEHSYSSDLDIFGQGSLFQYINTTTTSMGRQTLKKHLTNPNKNKKQIQYRQEAINELAPNIKWRQEFMAEGLTFSGKPKHDNNSLYKFIESKDPLYTQRGFIIRTKLLPVMSIGLIILTLLNILPYQIPILAVASQALLLVTKNKKRSAKLNLIYEYKDNIKVYNNMLTKIEKTKFKSPYLIELKNTLIGSSKETASQRIKKLEKITDNVSNRSNFAFIVINVLLLWDFQCMIALERWKKESGAQVKVWLESIGEIEALASLSNLKCDNPDWVTPEIVDKAYSVVARDLGHPLLTEERVCNDLDIDDSTKVLLITGSNMSGKSTYLRTAGINLLLAYAGAPVCAKEFSCSILNIHTCMRVNDDLEKNISSFYAELLRIKKIVDASKKEKTFFLLDEVFKGTNSHDRHKGAKILINKLLDNKAIGLVSTHDLELEVLEKESNKKIRNYHFKEHYENNEIYFDYKLRPGISTTSNAMYLIKMIGIDD